MYNRLNLFTRILFQKILVVAEHNFYNCVHFTRIKYILHGNEFSDLYIYPFLCFLFVQIISGIYLTGTEHKTTGSGIIAKKKHHWLLSCACALFPKKKTHLRPGFLCTTVHHDH